MNKYFDMKIAKKEEKKYNNWCEPFKFVQGKRWENFPLVVCNAIQNY